MKTEIRRFFPRAKNASFAFWLLAGLALVSQPSIVLGTELPVAVDLRADAEQAAKIGGPLIVLYSRKDCKYCETVRRDYLKPLESHPRFRDKVIVRQVNQDSDAGLNDFRGEKTTQARFAGSEKIKLVPMVAFYGRDGKRLADPIVGARLPDFYQSYLDDAIDQSIAKLKAR